MVQARFSTVLSITSTPLLALFTSLAAGATLCVTPDGSHGCYSQIQSAVDHASKGDVIQVYPGTYKGAVTIGKSVSLTGAGPELSIVDASNRPNGILVDGLTHPNLGDVNISGLTVTNANFEGVLVVSAADVIIRNNHIVNNTKTTATFGAGPHCDGQPSYETDESGDGGGGLHLIGTVRSTITG